MRAYAIHGAGGPEALIPEEVPVPQVRPGCSLIRIRAFGLNHSEIFTRQGLSPSVTSPRILGIECTGGIAETTDPERLPRGQKVVSLMGEMGRAFDGSYADYALVPNGQIYPAASDLPWEKPAAIPETGYTAYGSIQSLKVEDADHVLVRGATSSVGIAAARLLVAAHPALDLAARHGTSQRTSCCVTLAADASSRTGTASFRRTGTSTRSSSSSALPPCAIPSPASRKAASALHRRAWRKVVSRRPFRSDRGPACQWLSHELLLRQRGPGTPPGPLRRDRTDSCRPGTGKGLPLLRAQGSPRLARQREIRRQGGRRPLRLSRHAPSVAPL